MNNPKVSGRDVFYGRQASADDLQRMAHANQQARINSLLANSGLGDMGMAGGQSLDELVNENYKEQQRRNFQQQMGGMNPGQQGNMRRLSMMEFGSGHGGGMDTFQFQPSSMASGAASVPNGNMLAKQRMASQRDSLRRQSANEMGLDTQFDDLGATFGSLTQSPVFQQAMDTDALDMDPSGAFMRDVQMGMDYGDGLEQDVSSVTNNMSMFPQSSFSMPGSSSLTQQASMQMPTQNQRVGDIQEGAEQTVLEKMPQMNMTDVMIDSGFNPAMMTSDPASTNLPSGSANANLPANSGMQGAAATNVTSNAPTESLNTEPNAAVNTFSTGPPLRTPPGQAGLPSYQNAYSQTGFDMLSILMRVAARPKPQINIGAVDMSCAFVVCDVTKHDIPIVYCSEMFERLTGYTRHEILGRNCRFLQAPDGRVQSGVKRKYVDDLSVFQVKKAVSQHQEAQISLINYRKGGQPFMNLLTMIPISWDSDELKYYVGFQVDLVDQPASITNKNPDGTYAINYQRGILPRYVLHTPETNRAKDLEMGPPLERDDVSMVLSTLGTGESDLFKRVLLENTDDVLHVLSLKGLFLYLSRIAQKVLEYEPHELVGTALSSVCHPSDIVPVTRELKDTSPGATVNVVYRIRRKHSGYTWFEAHGALHTEQGKGKKCIILVGRERPVYALQRADLVNAAEIGENELWTKMSTSGMFLFVSSHARSLLDRQPDELRGTSAQALMRPESKAEFNRMLDLARIGVKSTFKHDIQNRRGQTLHAQTTLYPGDACEGQKPTFLVAQTKLLKMNRSTPTLNKQSSIASDKSVAASGGPNTPSTAHSGGMAQGSVASGSAAAKASVLSPTTHLTSDAAVTGHGGAALAIGTQHHALASEDNVFEELKTTRSTSWQFELRQMEKRNRVLAEEMQSLNSSKKKRKRRKGLGQLQKDCANCHTRSTPEWRRGPSGQRDLCNSCGLRWAKQNGRVSPRTSSQQSDKNSLSPVHSTSPNPTEVAKGGGGGAPGTAAPGAGGGMASPKTWNQQASVDSHNAKTARMEAQAMTGYGGGIPAKIEEVNEPAD